MITADELLRASRLTIVRHDRAGNQKSEAKTKHCRLCNKTLPIDHFTLKRDNYRTRHLSAKDGVVHSYERPPYRRWACKACEQEYMRAYRKRVKRLGK
jgi:hypothetical protein